MLAASMAVGHLLTATEQEPSRPPHCRLPRSPREMLRKALSQLAWAHLKAVEPTPASALRTSS
jgi:hypothetical protein